MICINYHLKVTISKNGNYINNRNQKSNNRLLCKGGLHKRYKGMILTSVHLDIAAVLC